MNFAKKSLSAIAVVAILALPFVAVAKAQSILDWWRLRNYSPPSNVSSLSQQDALTAYATHVFYVNHPKIVSSAATFKQDCSASEQTIVLGCYQSDQNGIYIYDVQDQRLNGVEQVTAAHEMLHAAYDRLSSSDKRYVNGLLLDYFNHDLHDQRIIDTINSYKSTEPTQLVNEMHSIFGTEVSNLPAPLEKYYSRYFSNRSVIATFASNYQAEFTSRQDQLNNLGTQLSQLKSQIDSEESSLSAQLAQINSDKANLDSERASGQIAAYNAGVASYNREVNAYNASIASLKNSISTYNELVGTYNSLASELANLEKAIDARAVPQSQ